MAAVRIVWRGGEVSEVQVALPVNALAALPRGAEMEARVLELARAGVRDLEIVQMLTAEGHRSTRLDLRILPSTVQAIRLRHGIKVAWRCTRWPPVPGWLTVTQAAARLLIPEKWLRKKLHAGVIRARLEPSGRYLIPDRPDALEALELLRAGTVSRADLLPGVRQQEGHRYA